MESVLHKEIEKLKENQNKLNRSVYAILTVALILITVMFLTMRYDNYVQQIDTVADILQSDYKESDQSAKLDKSKIMEHYGYDSLIQTKYGRKFLRDSAVIILANGFIYAVCIFCIKKSQKQDKTAFSILCKEIAEQIKKIQRNETLNINEELPYDAEQIAQQLEELKQSIQTIRTKSFTEAEKTKRLVTEISHQLKTPVTALKSNIDILQREEISDEEKKEFTNRIATQIAGLEKLTNSLVNISRMETGLIEIKKENAPIFDTILEAVNRIYTKAEEKNIEISMVKAEGLEEMKVPHDRKWLCEAVLNLLDNGIKYSPEGSNIEIFLEKRNSFFRIEVKDQGIGIPKEEYHKVFGRFYRGDSAVVKNTEGSGIGLYLARSIVEQHQGMLFIDKMSARNKTGCKFVIQIPKV